MPLNSTLLFDVHPISLETSRVAHPVSGIVGETLVRVRVLYIYTKNSDQYFSKGVLL